MLFRYMSIRGKDLYDPLSKYIYRSKFESIIWFIFNCSDRIYVFIISMNSLNTFICLHMMQT